MSFKANIVFASNNYGKWLELKDDFAEYGINLIFSEEKLQLEEDEQTLVSNSLSKARSAAKQTGLPALGDDSGIFVTQLDYFPGVHSRRWYGEPTEDRKRCLKLLEMMKGEFDREVFLISRFVLVDENGKKLFTTAVKNRFLLTEEIRGENGFGYDPILLSPKFEKTMGEMTQEEKNIAANRGRIALEVRSWIDSHGGTLNSSN